MACMRPVDAISGGPEVIGCRSALESFVSSQLANESFVGGSDSGGTPASPFNKDAAWITCDAVTRACSKKPPWRTALQTAYLSRHNRKLHHARSGPSDILSELES